MIVTIDFLFIQLSLVSSETPSKIQSTLKEVEEFSRQLSILKEQYSELKVTTFLWSEWLVNHVTYLIDV